jgi:uncharacterized protein YjbJ (UPF0337 family)
MATEQTKGKFTQMTGEIKRKRGQIADDDHSSRRQHGKAHRQNSAPH